MKLLTLSCALLLSLALTSCSSDEEEDPVVKYHLTYVDNLPDAEKISSTTAYVPVNDEGDFWLYISTEKDMFAEYVLSRVLYTDLTQGVHGFNVEGLDPGTTYYYTMCTQINGKQLFSKEIKSFTTQEVSIEFMEPQTVSMVNWNKLIPRVKTTNIDDSAAAHDLFVRFESWQKSTPKSVSVSSVTRFSGDGVWIDDSDLLEGTCYQAFVINRDGTKFAQPPVMLWENGALVEVK